MKIMNEKNRCMRHQFRKKNVMKFRRGFIFFRQLRSVQITPFIIKFFVTIDRQRCCSRFSIKLMERCFQISDKDFSSEIIIMYEMSPSC